MPLSDYLAGLAELTLVLAAVVAAAILLVRRIDALTRSERALAVALVATAGLLGVHLVPALLGILSPLTSLLAAAIWLAIAVRLRGRRTPPARTEEDAPPGGLPSRLIAGVTLLGLAAVAIAVLLRERTHALVGLDMVNFHLPGVARWNQLGSVWDIHQFGPNLAHGNYPHNGDFLLLATVLPWDNDFLVRFVVLVFWALTTLAVYVAARELGAPRTTAALAGAAAVSIPVVADASLHEALPDAVLYFAFTAGIACLLRHRRTEARSDLLLAGLGLGIAFGTKWYGVSAVAIAVASWMVWRLLGRVRPRTVLARTAALTAMATAGGAAWLARNWVESGNPFFPVKLELAGVTIFDAPFDVQRESVGFSVAHYATDRDVWADFLLPIYRDFLGLPALALGALAVLALAAALPRAAGDSRVRWLGVLALLLAAMYSVLPYSAQGPEGAPGFAGFNTRYLVPALLCCAPLAAWVAVRFPRARVGVELALAAAIVDGMTQRLDVPLARAVLVAAALAGLAALGAAAWPRRERLGSGGARLALAAGGLVVALVLVGAGHRTQRDFNEARYRGFDATFDWVYQHAPADHRIALADEWSKGVGSPFPMFGPRLENEVEYLGPWREEMMREHVREEDFVEHFRRGRFDLLLVGRSFRAAPGDPPSYRVPEEVWAERAGLQQVAQSDTFTLFRRPAP